MQLKALFTYTRAKCQVAHKSPPCFSAQRYSPGRSSCINNHLQQPLCIVQCLLLSFVVVPCPNLKTMCITFLASACWSVHFPPTISIPFNFPNTIYILFKYAGGSAEKIYVTPLNGALFLLVERRPIIKQTILARDTEKLLQKWVIIDTTRHMKFSSLLL